MLVFTGCIGRPLSFTGRGRVTVNITPHVPGGPDAQSKSFAPPMRLVEWGDSMRTMAKKRTVTNQPNHQYFSDLVWLQYKSRYQERMRLSRKENRSNWDALLDQKQVLIVCSCGREETCLRHVLSSELVALGAEKGGDMSNIVDVAVAR